MIDYIFNLNSLRGLFRETMPRTHKKAFTPTITQKTLKNFREKFIPNHVGGSGATTWGAQSALFELAVRLLMAVANDKDDSIIILLREAIPDKENRQYVASRLRQIAIALAAK